MKKYLIAFGLSFLLVGCSFGPFQKGEDIVNKTSPKPPMTESVSVENFYFNAGESGLTLLNTDSDDFSVKLSEEEIGEANILDGVLTFTEILEEGENIKVVNLGAYAESLSR